MCRQGVVTRASAERCEYDDDNIAVFKRAFLSAFHPLSSTITPSDLKFA